MSGLNERINSRNQLPQAHSSTMRTIPAKRKAVENSSPPSTSSSNVAPRLSTPHVDLRLLSGARHRRGETRAAARNAFTHQNQPRRSSGSLARSEIGNETLSNAFDAKLLHQAASSSQERSSTHTTNFTTRPASGPSAHDHIKSNTPASVVHPTATSFLPPTIHDLAYRQLVNPQQGAGSKDAPITLSSDEDDEDPNAQVQSDNQTSGQPPLLSLKAKRSPTRIVSQTGGAVRNFVRPRGVQSRAKIAIQDVQEIRSTNHQLGPTMSLLQAARGIQTRAYPQQAQPIAPVQSEARKPPYRVEKRNDREVYILEDSDDDIIEAVPPITKAKSPVPSLGRPAMSPVQILSSGSSRESSHPMNDVSTSSPGSRSSPAGPEPSGKEAVEGLLPEVADLSIDSGGILGEKSGSDSQASALLSRTAEVETLSPSKVKPVPHPVQVGAGMFTRYHDMMRLMSATSGMGQDLPNPRESPLSTKSVSKSRAVSRVVDKSGDISMIPLLPSKLKIIAPGASIGTRQSPAVVSAERSNLPSTDVSPLASNHHKHSISNANRSRNQALPGLSGSVFAKMKMPTGFEDTYNQSAAQLSKRPATASTSNPPEDRTNYSDAKSVVSMTPESEHSPSENSPIHIEDIREDVMMNEDDRTVNQLLQDAPLPAGLSANKAAVVAEIIELTDEMARLMNRPSYKTDLDIPEEIYPHMNAMSLSERKSGNAKRIFEALMAEDEDPSAPPIRLYNDVDDEVSPAFEFVYSNKMYYASDIPGPDYENLKGCDCVGGCDPKNGACSCLRRQEYWTADHSNDDSDFRFEGFGYNERGQLKDRTYPIFECNIACGCDATCMNRVVQHGRQVELHIVKTARKGWGVFAGAKPIPTGTFLGIYAGELMGTDLAEKLGLSKYKAIQRTYVLDIDNWFLSERFKPDSPEGFHAMPPAPPADPGEWEAEYCVDAFRVANWSRFINHSCEPNAAIQSVYVDDADFRKPLICLFAHTDIAAFAEICFSYHGLEAEVKQDEALTTRGVKDVDPNLVQTCHCGAKTCRGVMFR